jgi:hypothetical protein
MRVAGQAPAAMTGCLVCELKAKGQGKGEHACDKCLPVAKELKVGRFIVEIDGDSPVFTGLAGSGSHGHPQVRWSRQLVTQDAGNASSLQEDRDDVVALPLNRPCRQGLRPPA